MQASHLKNNHAVAEVYTGPLQHRTRIALRQYLMIKRLYLLLQNALS